MQQPFQFFAPLSFFEKASAPQGQRRRIAGIISTEVKDKQDEVLLQRGLDFSPFVKSGWFNDNHSKKTTDVLGYPDGDVKRFKKGDVLPDGQVAKSNGTWAEGYLLETPEAERVWTLAQALKKSGDKRRLGFSIEGQVLERTGPGGKTVAKAIVRNVAITNCPVGEDTRLEVLAKSLARIEKGMTMGDAPAPGDSIAAEGPKTGAGAGRLLTRRHVEVDDEDLNAVGPSAPKDTPVTKSFAVAAIGESLGCDRATAEQVYETINQLARQGSL